jgi:hypothetical protein
MRPVIAIQGHSIPNDLGLLGVPESNCQICHQPSRFIDPKLFEQWFRETFLEELKSNREAAGYSGPAILILNSDRSHDGDYSGMLASARTS